ncbi:hypothetical protein RHGRI_021674 [Rhododendron griersonianum]|uniref:Uncharacterized protein n=1 Tax=Rhododendron griersonianum TaxID=479676 RepID=A0AAV6JPA4_9ERIC|nr:hypothetical protein RHGRI_021674 [Rhododendron griersonianum]
MIWLSNIGEPGSYGCDATASVIFCTAEHEMRKSKLSNIGEPGSYGCDATASVIFCTAEHEMRKSKYARKDEVHAK